MAGRVSTFFRLAGDGDRDAEVAGISLSLAGRFELILFEWHLTPEYILDNWTDEQFELLCEKRNERMIATNDAMARASGESKSSGPAKRVSDVELFQQMGIGSA